MSSTYVVGLGSNLGSRAATFDAAIALLEQDARVRVERCSAVYESAPLGPPQPSYLNAAVRIASELDAPELLACLLSIERALGRTRGVRWAARSIDLDLLWASRPHASGELTVPHRELSQRWFALAPLLDVAPELEPVYGDRLAAMGGRRQPAGALAELVRADVEPTQDGLSIRATGSDDEATAALLSTLGRALHPSSTCQELRTIALPQTGDRLASILPLIEQGFAFDRASVAPETEAGPSIARMIGAFVSPYVALRLCDVRRDAQCLIARFAIQTLPP